SKRAWSSDVCSSELERPGLHQANPVADAAGVRLVVHLVPGRPAENLAVQGVLDPVLDLDNDGFFHLVADDVTFTGLAVVACRGLVLTHSAASFVSSADSPDNGMLPRSCSRGPV